MDTSNRADVAIKVVSAISISFTICCMVLCCGAYVLSKKKYMKQNQIHLTNQRNPSLTPTQIFALDVPDTLPSDSPNLYFPHEPPPLYQSIEKSSASLYFSISLISTSDSTVICFSASP